MGFPWCRYSPPSASCSPRENYLSSPPPLPYRNGGTGGNGSRAPAGPRKNPDSALAVREVGAARGETSIPPGGRCVADRYGRLRGLLAGLAPSPVRVCIVIVFRPCFGCKFPPGTVRLRVLRRCMQGMARKHRHRPGLPLPCTWNEPAYIEECPRKYA